MDAERGVSKYLETSDIESSEAEGRSFAAVPRLVEVSNEHNPVPEVVAHSSSLNLFTNTNQLPVRDVGTYCK